MIAGERAIDKQLLQRDRARGPKAPTRLGPRTGTGSLRPVRAWRDSRLVDAPELGRPAHGPRPVSGWRTRAAQDPGLGGTTSACMAGGPFQRASRWSRLMGGARFRQRPAMPVPRGRSPWKRPGLSARLASPAERGSPGERARRRRLWPGPQELGMGSVGNELYPLHFEVKPLLRLMEQLLSRSPELFGFPRGPSGAKCPPVCRWLPSSREFHYSSHFFRYALDW